MTLWSIGVYDYGLTSEQFWDLTPLQFEAIGRRHEIHSQQEDYRSGVLVAIVCNMFRGKNDKPTEIGDFFPSLKRVVKQKPQTVAEMRAILESMMPPD